MKTMLSLSLALGLAALAPAAMAAPPAYEIVAHIKGPDGGWDYASFDAVRQRVYVARSYGVMTIDAVDGQSNPHFADGARGHEVMAIPGADDVLSTNSGDNTARIFSGKDGTLEASLKVGNKPDAAAYDPASKDVFVMNGDSGDASIIDPAARKVVGSIPIGGALEFAVADGKGKLFVNVEDKGEVAVLDTRAAKLITRYPLKGCVEPSGLAYTRQGLLISACANGVAKVLDAATGADLATLKIGARPDAVIYDADRNLAFIPCGGDGVLTVIALGVNRSAQVVGSIPTQRGARTGALDPKTGRIYLPTAQFNPPAAAGQRPSVIPGSFEVLVLAPAS